MRVMQRVQRLERAATATGMPCRACGARPGEKSRRYHFFSNGEEPTGPDQCPGCRRKLVYRFELDRLG